MRRIRIKFADWVPNHEQNRQAGFGIIESLIVLLLISGIAAYMGNYFMSNKDMVVKQRAKVAFEEDVLRLMMITEENSVCEYLNIIPMKLKLSGPDVVIKELNSVDLQNIAVLKKGQKRFTDKSERVMYKIDKITLRQLSIKYADYPQRARARFEVYPKFTDRMGLPRMGMPQRADIEVILAADKNGVIQSCYGSFSRRIACQDANGVYRPEEKKNCTFE